MGGLFSSLGKKSLPDIYIDLESAQPKSNEEAAIFDAFRTAVVAPSESIFNRFSHYKDGQELAAVALSNPSTEAKEAAWDAIYPNIELQMEVYHFAKTISEHFIRLIRAVMAKNSASNQTCDVFSDMPGITKCFVDCFDIILTFDEIKLTLPKLLNDLAFFRRNVQAHNSDNSLDDILDTSNSSTIFWAAPTPMLNEAITSLQASFPPTSPDFEKLLILIGSVSDIATAILTKHHFESEKPNKLCLRCIVGATLIFDHISTQGAFQIKSNFHVKEALETLVGFQPKQTGLINAIKYSSKHLNDPTTDPKIKQIIQ